MKPWQGSQQEVPESHEAEPKEETENMKAVKDTTPKRKKENEASEMKKKRIKKQKPPEGSPKN